MDWPADQSPGPGDSRIDVLISYAHQNAEVLATIGLVERLGRCRTRAGRRVRVWQDVQPGDISPGSSFYREIAAAIAGSAAVVSVYSSAYFASRDCGWELEKAFQAHMQGRTKLIPLLIEEKAREQIPFYLDHLQYILLNSREDWFGLLLDRLGLLPATEQDPLQLAFLTQPPGAVVVNHTLAPIRVGVRARDAIDPTSVETVTLTLANGQLSGTASRPADGGVAEFTDLSIESPVESTRLVASCQPCAAEVSSRPFTVSEPGPARTVAPATTTDVIGARGGAARFLGAGGALAILFPDRVEILDPSGSTMAAASLDAEPRLIRCRGSTIAIGTWTGSVTVGVAGGPFWSWRPAGDRHQFAVPGDLAISGHDVYVGFWNGAVHRLGAGPDQPPDPELSHDAGVQALAVAQGRLCVCDLDGRLWVRGGGQLVWSRRLEPVIWLLKPYQGALVAVGDRNLYHLPLDGSPGFEEPVPLDRIAGVFGDTDLPVIVDVIGRGIRIDEQLQFRQTFHAVAGNIPTSADRDGRWCVLSDRSGQHSLVGDGRVVLTHQGGTLAVAPEGDRLAIEDEQGLRVVPPAGLRNR
jgi:TIR domain